MKDPSRSSITKNHLVVLKEIITIHFGKNPVSGGKPAKDRRRILNNSSVYFDFNNDVDNWSGENIL